MKIDIPEYNPDLTEPSLNTMFNKDQGGSKIVVIGKPGCFAKGTLIRLYNETIKNVEDIVETDIIMGDDFKPRYILNLCHGFEQMYRIDYTDINRKEQTVYVNASHILSLIHAHEELKIDIPLQEFLRFKRREDWCWYGYDQNKRLIRSIYMDIFPTDLHTEYFGFELKTFHRFLLSDGSVVHNTGKTTLITSLLYEKRMIFPIGLVMSGTEDSNGHYQKIFPSSFIYNRLDEKKLNEFITRQKIAKKHLSNPWAILLLDDCTDDPKLFNKPIFQGIFKNGRHWKMLFILSLQYCMDVKPVIRTNVDGVFILREPNLRNRKSLWENYAGIIPDFSLFCSILDVITDDYTALYIHNATTTNRWQDCIYWYKAKHAPKFKFGSKDFWKFHNQRFNKDYKDSF